MISYIWPIALVIISNTVYQICEKSVPENVSPFASLTITYFVGMVISATMYLVTDKNHNFVAEIEKMNWAPYVLGIVIIGLEAGFIYVYKAGWQISTASIVQSTFLAIALIVVGALVYHEALTWNKILGIVICMIGLVFINWK